MIQKNTFNLFFLCLLLLTGQKIQAKEIIISAELLHPTEKTSRVARINFFHPLISYSPSICFDESNRFCIRQDMLFAQDMTIEYGGRFITLYVEPGDSIHVSIDASLPKDDTFKWLTIEGNNAVKSMLINRAVANFAFPRADYQMPMPIDAFMMAVDSSYNEGLRTLKLLALPPDVECFIKKMIKYQLANDCDNLIAEAGPDSTYCRYFSSTFSDIYNPKNFETNLFSYHLTFYMNYLLGTEPDIRRDAMNGKTEDAVRKGIELLMKEPESVARDIMVYSFLYGNFINMSPHSLDFIKDFRPYFTHPQFAGYMEKAIADLKNPTLIPTVYSGISYLNKQKEKELLSPCDIISYLVDKYSGKIIYIDVFATWCGPCIREMKNNDILHTALRGENVVFVTLCQRSSEKKWEEYITQASPDSENYFFGDDDATLLFMSNFRMSGYPTYILLDRKGKLITTRAPRPSQADKLKELIRRIDN